MKIIKLIKLFIDKLLHYIDNGKFFREPMKIFYLVNGFLPAITPIAYSVAFLFFVFGELIPNDHKYENIWTKFLVITGGSLIGAWLAVIALLSIFYWINRKNQLTRTVRVGDNIKAIPIIAHYITCAGESTGLMLALTPLGSYIIVYVMVLLGGYSLLPGGIELSLLPIVAIGGVVGFALLVIAMFLICYPIVLLSHVVGEKLRIKAQLANDLRDVSDIHRAATMTEETEDSTKNNQ